MPDKSYSIGFTTSADTTGAQRASDSIRQISDDEARYNERKKQFLSAQEREVAEVERLVNAARKLRQAKAEEQQVVESSGKALKNSGQFINDLSYQIQDMSVQVSSGTSLMRSFSQQAPQMLSAFTQYGVITGKMSLVMGGLAAAIPLVILGFSKIGEAFGQSAEEAEKSAESFGKLSEKVEKSDLSKIDGLAAALKLSNERALSVAKGFPELQKASNDFARSAITDAEMVEKAQISVAKALGLQLDQYKLIDLAEDRARQMRIQKRKEETDALKKQWDDSVIENKKAFNDFNAAIQKAEDIKAELNKKRNEILDLKNAQAIALQVKKGVGLTYDVSSGMAGVGGGAAMLTQESEAKVSRANDTIANKAQDDKRIADLEKSVSTLDSQLKALWDRSTATGQVAELQQKLDESTSHLEEIKGAIEKTLQKNEATAKAEELNAVATKINSQQQQLAKDLNQVVDNLKLSDGAPDKPLADLKKKTSDLLLDVSEARDAIIDLGEIKKMLLTGLAKTTNTSETNTSSITALMGRIDRIEAQAKIAGTQVLQGSTNGLHQ